MSEQNVSENLTENKKAILFFSLIFLIYALLPTKNYYWDGIFFSQAVEDAVNFSAGLFHPNHLFFNSLGFVGFKFFEIIGYPLRAVYVFQIFSIIAGVSSAFVVFKILKSVTSSDYLSFGLTAIFAFSATWWKFATDADAYILSITFLLVSFYLILPGKKPRPFLTALAHTGAMCFHELAVFFFPAVVLGLIFQTANAETVKSRFLTIIKYAAGVFLLTFSIYCVCFCLQNGAFELKSFVRWITFYTTENGFSGQELSNLQLTLRGNRQLFFNGSAGFQARDVLNIILMIFLAASVISFLFQTARYFFDIKTVWKMWSAKKAYFQPVSLLCYLWIAPHSFFLFYFIPANTFYRLFYFPALIILAGALFAPFENSRPIRHRRLACFALILALSNFLFFIRPQSQIRENTPLALAAEANRIWTAKTIVYFDSLDADNRIVRYFTPAVSWKPLDLVTADEFENRVRTVYQNGGSVWLESSAAKNFSQSPETARILTENSARNQVLELKNTAANVRYIQFMPSTEK